LEFELHVPLAGQVTADADGAEESSHVQEGIVRSAEREHELPVPLRTQPAQLLAQYSRQPAAPLPTLPKLLLPKLNTQGAPLLSAGQVPAVLSTMLVTRHQQLYPLLEVSATGGFVV
jgi:hypothetical protein